MENGLELEELMGIVGAHRRRTAQEERPPEYRFRPLKEDAALWRAALPAALGRSGDYRRAAESALSGVCWSPWMELVRARGAARAGRPRPSRNYRRARRDRAPLATAVRRQPDAVSRQPVARERAQRPRINETAGTERLLENSPAESPRRLAETSIAGPGRPALDTFDLTVPHEREGGGATAHVAESLERGRAGGLNARAAVYEPERADEPEADSEYGGLLERLTARVRERPAAGGAVSSAPGPMPGRGREADEDRGSRAALRVEADSPVDEHAIAPNLSEDSGRSEGGLVELGAESILLEIEGETAEKLEQHWNAISALRRELESRTMVIARLDGRA